MKKLLLMIASAFRRIRGLSRDSLFLPSREPLPLEFSINGIGHEYLFSLHEKQNRERGEEFHLKDIKQWELSILQSETGHFVFKDVIEDNAISVNTSGWKAGIYIAVANINGKNIAQKFAVTE